MQKIGLVYKGKRISLNAVRKTFLGMAKGLMFSQREKARIIIFQFRKARRIDIHSFFVFYPFVAVWLGKSNRVLGFKIVKPFTFHAFCKKKAFSLVEIPINKRNSKVVKRLYSAYRR